MSSEGESVARDWPEHVYRYRPLADSTDLDRIEVMLLEGRHFFTAAEHFNDPFDCSPSVSVSESKLSQRLKLYKIFRRRFPDEDKKARKKIIDAWFRNGPPEANLANAIKAAVSNYGICCFAEGYDNILMWSHDATRHRGVCLRFRPDKMPLKLRPFEVRYAHERPILGLDLGGATELIDRVILTKADAWRYEGEWRTIDLRGATGLRDLPHPAVDAIYLGAAIDNGHQEQIKFWAQTRSSTTAVFKARFSDRIYGLEFDQLV